MLYGEELQSGDDVSWPFSNWDITEFLKIYIKKNMVGLWLPSCNMIHAVFIDTPHADKIAFDVYRYFRW